MLACRKIDAVLLNGQLSRKARSEVMRGILEGRERVILATSSLAGEGLDVPHLDALFLASPVKFSGRLTQYVGRVLRPSPGKKRPRVYDYIDPLPVLEYQAKARQKVFEGMAA